MIRPASDRVCRVILCAMSALVFDVAGAGAQDAGRFEAAREHFQKGRYDEALEAYSALEKREADPAAIALGRSQCHEARGELRLAAETLAAAAKDGRDAALQARLAELYFEQGDFERSAAALEKALALEPEQPLARLVQADLWTATGQLKQADEGYRWFVRYYNRVQPTDPTTLLLVARAASQYARWHSVSDIFNFVVNTLCPDALAHDKSRWQAHLVAGELFLEKFNRRDGLPELRKALAINPQAADVYAALAAAAFDEHALAEAEQHAGRALAVNPGHIRALLIRADLRLEADDLTQARDLGEQALNVNPRDERAWARLAACNLLEDGAPPAAELDELFRNLDSIAEAKFDKPSRFTRLVRDLAAVNPHPGVFLTILGEKLEGRRKFDIAERCYKQASLSMPQLAAPKTALGMLYLRIGKNGEAAKILDQAFEADPYHVRVSNLRKVLKVLDGYETISSDHFAIRVDTTADRILGHYMSTYLEEQYPELVRQFGYEPDTRTQFEIFHKARGLSAHEWFSARMVGLPWVQTIGASTGMIVALTSPTASDKPFNWARVVKHEFVHILTLQKTRFNIPHWFTEALAVMSEGYPPPEQWNRLLLERVPRGDVMNLDNINQGFIRPGGIDDWNMAYCQSRLYAKYMIDKFGPETIPTLLEAYRNNLSTDRAIPRVFGVDKEAFEKGYREYVQAIVERLKAIQPDQEITLAQAEKAHLAKPDDPQTAARYAFELLRINRRTDARKLAEQALTGNKKEPLAAVVMASLELRSEDLNAAVGWLEPALDRDRPHPHVLSLLADLKLKQQKYPEAIDLYNRGLALDPERLSWLKGLSTALSKAGQTEKLKPVLEHLTLADGDDPAPRQRLARLALDEGNNAAAVRYGRMALEIDVMDPETHRVLGRAYAGLSLPEKAAAEWAVALELAPDDAETVLELARAEAATGKKDVAIRRLQGLLKRKSDYDAAKKLLEQLQN